MVDENEDQLRGKVTQWVSNLIVAKERKKQCLLIDLLQCERTEDSRDEGSLFSTNTPLLHSYICIYLYWVK